MKFEYSKKEFERHLKKEHKMSAISNYLKEIVFGGSDGIVTTFAVVAGFNGAQSGNLVELSVLVVLLFGLANLFADASSMGLGSILSILADKDVYKTEREKERKEIQTSPDMEKAETMYILQSRGFSKDQASKITELYSQNENYWLDFMMYHELELPNPAHENPIISGFSTFASFIIFGSIPLLPYLLGLHSQSFTISILFTFLALVMLGIIRWKVTTQTLLRSVGEIVLIGGTSAVIAFFVGTLFRG